MFGSIQTPGTRAAENSRQRFLSSTFVPYVFLLLFATITFVIYFSILDNEFLSDDYDSLHRITIENQILTEGFFRPLIDISFLLNYYLSGLNPMGYYLFNIIVHVLNVFMIFQVARRMKLTATTGQLDFAFLAALLFLFYPFHNEAIVWLSGRLASIACCFALVALYAYVTPMPRWRRITAATICFITGLLAYESIVVLPAVLLLFSFEKHNKRFYAEITYWVVIVSFYFLMRSYFSGAVYGDYGERVVTGDGVIDYAERFAKILGRMFLPPSDHIVMQIILFVTLMCTLIGFLITKRKALKIEWSLSDDFVKLVLSLLGSTLIPAFFGVSTRTTEGDRLMYFPSVFLCLLFSYVMIRTLKAKSRWLTATVICIYFLFFLQKSNRRWNEASEVAANVLDTIKAASCSVLINLPDEIEGAFVFRNGFEKSLVVHGLDPEQATLGHLLIRSEYLSAGAQITPRAYGDTISIHPGVLVVRNGSHISVISPQNQHNPLTRKSNCLIYFWDKSELNRLF